MADWTVEPGDTSALTGFFLQGGVPYGLFAPSGDWPQCRVCYCAFGLNPFDLATTLDIVTWGNLAGDSNEVIFQASVSKVALPVGRYSVAFTYKGSPKGSLLVCPDNGTFLELSVHSNPGNPTPPRVRGIRLGRKLWP